MTLLVLDGLIYKFILSARQYSLWWQIDISIIECFTSHWVTLLSSVCDKKDLDKMADRLQGWFVTLHEKHQEKIHPHISKRSVGEGQTGEEKSLHQGYKHLSQIFSLHSTSLRYFLCFTNNYMYIDLFLQIIMLECSIIISNWFRFNISLFWDIYIQVQKLISKLDSLLSWDAYL